MQEKQKHIIFQVLNFLHGIQSQPFNLSDAEKLLLITLASHKGAKGIYPSMSTLARELKKGYSTIKRLVSSLRKKGVITVINNPGLSCDYLLTAQLTVELGMGGVPSSPVSPHPAQSRATPQLTGEPLSTNSNNQVNNRERAAVKHAAPSLSDFEPTEMHKTLSIELRVNLEAELKSFRYKHSGKGNLSVEFEKWLKLAHNYQSKQVVEDNRPKYRDFTAERLAREALNPPQPVIEPPLEEKVVEFSKAEYYRRLAEQRERQNEQGRDATNGRDRSENKRQD